MGRPAVQAIRTLFRYRDLVAKTLEEHKKIIKEGNPCWWGWWKRPSEPPRFEVWGALQKDLDQRGVVFVGLFNSGARDPQKAVHRARITAIIPPEEDTHEQTPELPADEKGFVPSYYRESPYSRAWLRIEEIEGKPIADFFPAGYAYTEAPPLRGVADEYRNLLKGKLIKDLDELLAMDTTIWLVHPRTDQDHDTDFKILVPGLRVTKPVSPEPIEAKGQAILHLTDLHFAVGEKHRSEHAWNYPDDDPKGATLDEQIFQALKAKSPVGVVVISGDFTYLASKAEFEQARKSVLLLLGSLGLGPEHLVIVPGNHDIAWTKGDTYEAGKPVEALLPRPRLDTERSTDS